MTDTLCAATFSNSYVLWRKRCVMLRFVAVPFKQREKQQMELWYTVVMSYFTVFLTKKDEQQIERNRDISNNEKQQMEPWYTVVISYFTDILFTERGTTDVVLI